MSIIRKKPLLLITCMSGIIVLINIMLLSDQVMHGIFYPIFKGNFKIAAKTVIFIMGGVLIFLIGAGWISYKNKEKIIVAGLFLILSLFSYRVLLNIDKFVMINVPGTSNVNNIPFNCINILPCETMHETLDTCMCEDDQLRLNKNILDSLHFDTLGHTFVFADSQWMMIDKEGEVVLSGIATVDNGPDYPADNRIRFRKDGKWGYANESGVVVIPAQFDGAMPFKNGMASVCIGCKVKYQGEYLLFDGGRKVIIDTSGNVVPKKQVQ